jgi:hypothetical protein
MFGASPVLRTGSLRSGCALLSTRSRPGWAALLRTSRCAAALRAAKPNSELFVHYITHIRVSGLEGAAKGGGA